MLILAWVYYICNFATQYLCAKSCIYLTCVFIQLIMLYIPCVVQLRQKLDYDT